MSLGRDPRGRGSRTPEPQTPEPQTATQRAFKGLNLTDTRLSIDDDELAMVENSMYVGKGMQAVPLYAGAAGTALHAGSLIKESFGCALTYGGNAVPHPVTIAIFEDGSAWMRDHDLDGAVDVNIAAPNTFSASPKRTAITIWQDGPVLIQDDTWGYGSWNGLALTLLDGTKLGHQFSVFEAHVWLLTAPRTITYTAPNSFSSFAAGDGAGSFKITDDAFEGQVYGLHSTVEQLWIVGAQAIDALGNVATSGGVTTFAVTNAITSLGTTLPDSIIGYFRALTFATGYSIDSLLGVTPQKLSQKIDRLFAFLTGAITSGPKSGIVTLNGRPILVVLFTYTDPTTTLASTKLLCFEEARWFLATTPDLGGNRVLDLVTLVIRGRPEVYGIDGGGFVYRIFARATDALGGTWTLRSKLYDLGAPVEGHQAIRVGFDLSAPGSTVVSPLTITLTSEAAQVQLGTDQIKFLALADLPLNRQYALHRRDAPIIGQRLGWSLSGPCADLVCLEAAHMEYAPTTTWDVVDQVPSVFIITTPGGVFTITTPSGTFTVLR
jgi:hypothetical protein